MKLNQTKFFEGGKVRRKCWRNYLWMKINDCDSTAAAGPGDLGAYDWEDVVDPVPESSTPGYCVCCQKELAKVEAETRHIPEEREITLYRYTMKDADGVYYQSIWINVDEHTYREDWQSDRIVCTETKTMEVKE